MKIKTQPTKVCGMMTAVLRQTDNTGYVLGKMEDLKSVTCFHLQKPEKGENLILKKQKKKMVEMRSETNEIQNRKTTEKTDKKPQKKLFLYL